MRIMYRGYKEPQLALQLLTGKIKVFCKGRSSKNYKYRRFKRHFLNNSDLRSVNFNLEYFMTKNCSGQTQGCLQFYFLDLTNLLYDWIS